MKPVNKYLIVLLAFVVFTSGPAVMAENAGQGHSCALTGFNTKGNLSTAEQVAMVRKEFAARKAGGFPTELLHLRIQGGTSSQVDMPADYADSMLKSWTEFQREFACKYMFVVNFNDTPESQASSLQRWMEMGAAYESIELGNEQYLPKYRKSKTDMREVTKRTSGMTAGKYVGMCMEYVEAFRKFKLPFYLQLAPEKEQYPEETWNTPVAKAVNSGVFGDAEIRCAVHLYEKGDTGSLDVTQIKRMRAMFSKPVRIAVTESGVTAARYVIESLHLNESLYSQFVEQERNLAKRLLGELTEGDLLLNQVLFNDYRKTHEPCFHPAFKGVTTKGRAILDVFADHLAKKH